MKRIDTLMWHVRKKCRIVSKSVGERGRGGTDEFRFTLTARKRGKWDKHDQGHEKHIRGSPRQKRTKFEPGGVAQKRPERQQAKLKMLHSSFW